MIASSTSPDSTPLTDKQAVDLVLPHIRKMVGYTPGLQPTDKDIIKLNTNENPFPSSSKVIEALENELQVNALHLYPNPTSVFLRDALAKQSGKTGDYCFVGNGSDEVLSVLFRSLLAPGDSLVCANPTYSLYPTLVQLLNANCIEVDLKPDWHMDFEALLRAQEDSKAKIVVITNPNAPTGIAESKEDLLNFAKMNPGITLIDEAYAIFGAESVQPYVGSNEYPRLMVTSTFSKSYSLAGQRIGWLIAPQSFVVELDKIRDSYNVSRLAQAAAFAALQDRQELAGRVEIVKDNRRYLVNGLEKFGFQVLPSSANFIFVKPAPAGSAKLFFEYLQKNKILVRYFDTPRCKDYIRITIGTKQQMEKLLEVTKGWAEEKL